MKKLLLVTVCVLSVVAVFAQEEEKEEKKGGFKKNNLFIGSAINLGFSNGFNIGLNPEIGYSINKFLDAGISTNFTYITQRSQQANYSIRYMAIGAGPFVRVWPIRNIFLGGQYEHNKISLSEKLNGVVTRLGSANSNSVLVGAGYGSREIGQSQFFTSILIDVLNDVDSPYRDQFGRIQPIFRTGFIIYLGRKNRDN